MYKRSSIKYVVKYVIILMNLFLINYIFYSTDEQIVGPVLAASLMMGLSFTISFVQRIVLEASKLELQKERLIVSTLMDIKAINYKDIEKATLFIRSKRSAILAVKVNGKFIRIRKRFFVDFDELCTELEGLSKGNFEYKLSMLSILNLPTPYIHHIKWQDLFDERESFFNNKVKLFISLMLIFYIALNLGGLLVGLIVTLVVLLIGLLTYRRGYSFSEAIIKSVTRPFLVILTLFNLTYILLVL